MDRQTHRQTEKQIHSLRVGWRNLFSSCAVVSVLVLAGHLLHVGWRNLPTLCVGMKTYSEIPFTFWLTLFYSIPLLALTDWQTEEQIKKDTVVCLAGARSLLRPEKKDTVVCLLGARFWRLQPEKKSYSCLSGGLCCCVSFWCWREIGSFFVVAGKFYYDRKKKIQLSVWRVRDHYYDRKKNIQSSVCSVCGTVN